MDPETLPADERSRSAQFFPCPYCVVGAGTRCRTASGDDYSEWSYVHIDRLITMYRDAYLNMEEATGSSWQMGFEYGQGVGWAEGVRDARYTFENTPVFRGALEEDGLRGAMEAAGVVRLASDEEAGSAEDPSVVVRLHSVPPDTSG